EDLVGYTFNELKEHLENQFTDKMNWGNYGDYWEIDHIKPKSSFDFEKPEDQEFKDCWSLDNLQPL
ncbi:MAG: HNH endonuclease signature motif containing protein, partial [archaeon]